MSAELERLPQGTPPPPMLQVCGTCAHMEPGQGTRGTCPRIRLKIRRRDVVVSAFDSCWCKVGGKSKWRCAR